MNEELELDGVLLRLEQVLIALTSLIAFVAIFEVSALDLELETDPMWYALAGALALTIVLRSTVVAAIDAIRPLRPLDMLTAAYAMVVAMFVFGLMVGEPGTITSAENQNYLGSILVVSHLILVVLSVTARGLALMQFNGLQLCTLATIASPEASPWCLAYGLLLALAITIRHHGLALVSVGGGPRLAPLARHCAWVTMALLALTVAVVPFFPDLRQQLVIELPDRTRRGIDMFELAVRGLIVGGLLLLFIGLLGRLRKLLLPDDAGKRGGEGDDEIEELLLDPLDATALTRRLVRNWSAGPRERLIDEYVWLVGRLAGQGFPRPAAQTARELGDRLVSADFAGADDVDALTALFHRARYTDREVAREDVDEAHRLARAILEAGRQ